MVDHIKHYMDWLDQTLTFSEKIMVLRVFEPELWTAEHISSIVLSGDLGERIVGHEFYSVLYPANAEELEVLQIEVGRVVHREHSPTPKYTK